MVTCESSLDRWSIDEYFCRFLARNNQFSLIYLIFINFDRQKEQGALLTARIEHSLRKER